MPLRGHLLAGCDRGPCRCRRPMRRERPRGWAPRGQRDVARPRRPRRPASRCGLPGPCPAIEAEGDVPAGCDSPGEGARLHAATGRGSRRRRRRAGGRGDGGGRCWRRGWLRRRGSRAAGADGGGAAAWAAGSGAGDAAFAGLGAAAGAGADAEASRLVMSSSGFAMTPISVPTGALPPAGIRILRRTPCPGPPSPCWPCPSRSPRGRHPP